MTTPDWVRVRELQESVEMRDAEIASLRSELSTLRASRAPVEPGAVTREHRYIAVACVGIKNPSSFSTIDWLNDGTGTPSCAFAFDVAQAIADAEARGAARVREQVRNDLAELAEHRERGLYSSLVMLDKLENSLHKITGGGR